jgi:hypothetical protein
MKICPRKNSGSTLLVCVFIASIIAVALVAYLRLIASQDVSAARSTGWNAAMPVLEAGIEEAMAHLNVNRGNLNSAGWTVASGGNYSMQRNWGDGYYRVTISTNKLPTITSTGFIRVPASTNYVSRTVSVIASNSPGAGIQVKNFVDLNGNSVVIDSFDSTSSLYSSNGIYAISKRTANARVNCNAGIVNSVNVGNADIWGSVATGPGGTVYTGANGSVGDLDWHNAGSTGVQPGAVTDNAAVVVPDPPPPPTGLFLPPLPGLVGLKLYPYVLGNAVYQITGKLSSSAYVSGNATLIVTGDVSFSGSDSLIIAPGASLKLYCYGNVKFGGGTIENLGGFAKDLIIYGMPTCASIDFSGGTSFTGQVLAPNADVVGGGGGSQIMNYIGSLQAKSFTMNGKFQFHYDESLGNNGAAYVIISWNEL